MEIQRKVSEEEQGDTEGSENDESEETQGAEAEQAEGDRLKGEEESSLKVPDNRREEIKEYLQLFGYNPNTSILQVHIPGKFGRGRSLDSKALLREAAKERYGGSTFVVVGRTHDPRIKKIVQPPLSKTSESYVGYLQKGADSEDRPPHQLLPLDFTPNGIDYPDTFREQFSKGSGWLITMHVPAAFAKDKNELMRAIKKAGKKQDGENEWQFIQDIKKYAFKRK